jgi:cyclic 2,3-diphosphoglycerate synthase
VAAARGVARDVRAVALVDGEHYPDVVREALETLPYDVVAAVLVGGTEKLRADAEYGVPLVSRLEDADADVVLDLSDEPVLGPRRRMVWASRALAAGRAYVGADFRFDPPVYHPFSVPSVAVIGTGKRVGKTAVTAKLARVLARDRSIVVVCMGRGGPREPEVVETPPEMSDLVALSRTGRHAASDHLEVAALTGLPTIGCRRAGGGLAGAPFTSNVLEGAALAAARRPDLVIFDGSGAAIPPIAVGTRILVAGARQDLRDGLNTYRVLMSDLVLLTSGGEQLAAEVRRVKDVPVVPVSLRLRPVAPLAGSRVAVFTAGPAATDHLDAEVVLSSANLADRRALRDDLATVDADVYLVELKAAAVDVVAEAALARGVPVVLADNDVVADDAGVDLAGEFERIVEIGSAA